MTSQICLFEPRFSGKFRVHTRKRYTPAIIRFYNISELFVFQYIMEPLIVESNKAII
jgi:hypothetical protein